MCLISATLNPEKSNRQLLLETISTRGLFKEEFELQDFPFDKQVLRLDFIFSRGRFHAKQMDMNPSYPDFAVNCLVTPDLELLEWKFYTPRCTIGYITESCA